MVWILYMKCGLKTKCKKVNKKLKSSIEVKLKWIHNLNQERQNEGRQEDKFVTN